MYLSLLLVALFSIPGAEDCDDLVDNLRRAIATNAEDTATIEACLRQVSFISITFVFYHARVHLCHSSGARAS